MVTVALAAKVKTIDMSEIKNEDLQVENIPTNPKSREADDFAYSFSGYRVYGSFKACAEASKKVRAAILAGKTEDLILSEVRAALFLYHRALHHCSPEDEDYDRLDLYLYLIREKVREGKIE
ncbi:MAG: hypothetical protein ACI85O_000905 [Saprospiraceae bacterium]|jgi:hypothetical protein